MKQLLLWWLLAALSLTVHASKFLFTAPNTLTASKNEKMFLNVFDNGDASDFTITLSNSFNGSEIHSVTVANASAKLHSIDFAVPECDQHSAHLQVHYGGKNLSASVSIVQAKTLMFIETDRPFYKPGELVRFRLLHLQRRLLPLSHSIKRVWIESATNTKMAQWKNVKVKGGMAQLEMQLSDEPVQGTWKIKVQATNTSEKVQKSFEVKEYVLPKFEVILSPPSYISASANQSYTWRVCAKYSFGKPVQGNASVAFSFKVPSYHWHSRLPSLSSSLHSHASHELRKEDGCHEFELHRELFVTFAKSYAYAVEVQAVVFEKGTGEQQQSLTTSTIHRESSLFDFVGSSNYYFPFLPYTGNLLVKLQSGQPVADAQVELTLQEKKSQSSQVKKLVTDSRGMVSFTIAPMDSNSTFSLTTKSMDKSGMEFYGSMEIIPWFSASSSYIQISPGAAEVACDAKATFEVSYTFNATAKHAANIKFFYLLKSRGEVVHKGHKNVKPSAEEEDFADSHFNGNKTPGADSQIRRGKWNLEINIDASFAPKSRLVIYHVVDDKEIVASSISLKIKNCFKHKVQSRFVEKHAQPGESVTLSLSTSSKSLCALSGVDRAVTFLDQRRALSTEQIFERLEAFNEHTSYNAYENYMVDECSSAGHFYDDDFGRGVAMAKRSTGRQKRWMMFGGRKGFGNTHRAFADVGMVILSNLDHNLKPCQDGEIKETCNGCPRRPMMAYRGSGGGVLLSMRADNSPVIDDAESARSFAMEARADAMDFDQPVAMSHQESSQETQVEMRTDFPETWLWQMEEIEEQEQKVMKLQTPHSITDWVLNTVCISPSEGLALAPETSVRVMKPYFMDFTLPYSVKRGEVLPLKVSLFNYLNDAIPIQLKFGHFSGGDLLSEEVFSTCLEGRDSLVHTFKLNVKVLGDHNISVTAGLAKDYNATCGSPVLANLRDGVMKSVKVKPEGYPVEITQSMFICLTEEGESASMSWHLPIPANAVPDSARGELAVIGDVMGPSMENLDGLVQLPMGCGEQNMILFVPNIVVLNYLNSTDAANPTLKRNAISNMVKGYQRELTYRHSDGSYSAFGKSDPSGSMWLTAFVVKSFAQAKKFIFIDDKDLDMSIKWIEKSQLENGCFPQIGTVFHKEMKGGLSDSESAVTSLSAYVLLSLLETNKPLKKGVIENGLFCLTKSEEKTDLYSTILTAYAMQLINERISTVMIRNSAEQFLNKLMEKATTGNDSEVFWQKEGTPNLALSIEMTSYAVLTLVKAGGEEHLMTALNAVKWISKQRNGQGGFVSTQDTIVALEALAKYASAIPSNQVKMSLQAQVDDSDQIIDFRIDQENRQILQQRKIPHLPTYAHWAFTGVGCCLVQSTVRYNLPKAAAKDDAFSLNASVTNLVAGICNELHLDVNMTYNLADESSNMAVLEVELLSGYEPHKSSLDQLQFERHLNFKRWDFDEGKLNLYFDSIKKGAPLHFGFVIKQKVIVEQIKPAQMKLYDYYEQESFVRQEYGLDGLICSWELLPAPEVVVVEAGNPQSTKLFALGEKTTPKSTESELADAPDSAVENAIDEHFRDFKNVDFDLETPEGIEGPIPALVKAPKHI